MIWLTVEQAAARIGEPEEAVRQWIRSGVLVAVKNPIDDHEYVQEDDLLDVERATRTRRYHMPQSDRDRTDPAPAAEILRWLRDRHGVDLGPGGPGRLRQWAVRYPGLRRQVDAPAARPGRPTVYYDRQAVLSVTQRLATRSEMFRTTSDDRGEIV